MARAAALPDSGSQILACRRRGRNSTSELVRSRRRAGPPARTMTSLSRIRGGEPPDARMRRWSGATSRRSAPRTKGASDGHEGRQRGATGRSGLVATIVLLVTTQPSLSQTGAGASRHGGGREGGGMDRRLQQAGTTARCDSTSTRTWRRTRIARRPIEQRSGPIARCAPHLAPSSCAR